VRLDDKPGTGELAVAVLDEYQGLGIARMLVVAVLGDCVDEDLCQLEMQVLGENRAAAALLQGLGAKVAGTHGSIDTYCLDARAALAALIAQDQPPGLAAVLAAV
jgi:ribosomal protein S18 acetylase RimI-like enzyme